MDFLLLTRGDQGEGELAPDTILPCQLGDGLFGAARLQPEKRLQLAVLHDAILTFQRWAGVGRARPRRRFAEVADWFASEETNSPFTFVTICDSLNLDPDYIRDGLRRWRAPVDGAAKRRSRFRREGVGLRHSVGPRPLRQVA
jgi:hypothetical protein